MTDQEIDALVDEFWIEDEKRFDLNFEDEIIKGCVITHRGEIVNQVIADHYAQVNKTD